MGDFLIGVVLLLMMIIGVVMLISVPRDIRAAWKRYKEYNATEAVEAEIIEWHRPDADEKYVFSPAIRYTYQGQTYEKYVEELKVTKMQREYEYDNNKLTIYLNPDAPEAFCPYTKGRQFFKDINGVLTWLILGPVMILIGGLGLWAGWGKIFGA